MGPQGHGAQKDGSIRWDLEEPVGPGNLGQKEGILQDSWREELGGDSKGSWS